MFATIFRLPLAFTRKSQLILAFDTKLRLLLPFAAISNKSLFEKTRTAGASESTTMMTWQKSSKMRE